MTTSSLDTGRGGPRRPVRLVVVSADPERRVRWASSFEAEGARTLRCAGPTVACALSRGLLRCPLLDEAGAAVYDVAAVTPEFLLTLVRRYPDLALVFARDSDGGRPVVERVSGGERLPLDVCFGRF